MSIFYAEYGCNPQNQCIYQLIKNIRNKSPLFQRTCIKNKSYRGMLIITILQKFLILLLRSHTCLYIGSPDIIKQNSQQKIYKRLQTFDEKTQIVSKPVKYHLFIHPFPVLKLFTDIKGPTATGSFQVWPVSQIGLTHVSVQGSGPSNNHPWYRSANTDTGKLTAAGPGLLLSMNKTRLSYFSSAYLF